MFVEVVPPFPDGDTVEAPPPTVEMMVRPTALVVVIISPAVREMWFDVVLGVVDATDGAVELTAPAEVADVTAGFVEAPLEGVVDGELAAAALLDASVVCPGGDVEVSGP